MTRPRHPWCVAGARQQRSAWPRCAVGPNFKPPAAPADAAFVPAGQLPAAYRIRTAARRRGAAIRRRLWTSPANGGRLFQSTELNALIETRPRKQPDARGRAGGAAAGERERPPRSAARYFRASRERSEPAPEGLGAPRSACPGVPIVFLHVEQRQRERVVHARCIRRHPPPGRSAAGAGRVRAIRPRGELSRASPPTWSPRRSPRPRCARRSRRPRTSRARSSSSSTSRSGASRRAAPRAPTCCSSRPPCKRRSRRLPALRRQLAQERNLLATYVGALPADYAGAANSTRFAAACRWTCR